MLYNFFLILYYEIKFRKKLFFIPFYFLTTELYAKKEESKEGCKKEEEINSPFPKNLPR